MTAYALVGVAPELPEDGNCWIAPTACVIGKVRLERFASVWFGAVIRGDNELITIGENSNVQDGAVMHTDPGLPLTVRRNCTIGHKAMLHGCRVQDGSLIGMKLRNVDYAMIVRQKIALVQAGGHPIEAVEARRHARHHVREQRTGQAVQRAVAGRVGRPGDDDGVVLQRDADRGVNVVLKRALRPLHAGVLAVERHLDATGDRNGQAAYARHGVSYQT